MKRQAKRQAKKILVTGATGFLGSHLVRVLCRDREPSSIRTLSQSRPSWLDDLGVEVLTGSVTSDKDASRAVDGVEGIYHLAGLVSRKPADAHRMYEVHVEGTRVLCEAARQAGVGRVVLASTSGTIAVSRRADEMPDETSPPPLDICARWPYYASKIYQEETARRTCGEAVELVTVNPGLLLGPGDERLSSTRDVLSFLARDIALIPPGGLNFVDVRDVAAVLPAAMDRGGSGQRYLLGGYNWSFTELFGRLERLSKVAGPKLKAGGKLPLFAAHAQAALYRSLGRTPPIEPASVEMAGYYWYFESGKAVRDLGFSVREATETLFDTVKYLRERFLGERPLRHAG